MLAKHQVDKIRDAMARSDPANADYYNQNADIFTAEPDSLDAFIRSELAGCGKSDFIAFHDAFTHFSKRYGLRQHSTASMGFRRRGKYCRRQCSR
jgi:zinc transport system substrate-binding protein